MDQVLLAEHSANSANSVNSAHPGHSAHVALLEAGELLAFPTETVYGLGADASNPAAVRKIFAAKGRPADHPLIVHMARAADLSAWSRELPEVAVALGVAFWPGPMTLIVQRAAHVLDEVTGGQPTVGLRVPAHPVALALLEAFRGIGQVPRGLAGPSANKFGHVSPTRAAHVRDEFGDSVAVLDGGASEVGIESTIIDCSAVAAGGRLRILRPGFIDAAALRAKLDQRFHGMLPEEVYPSSVSTKVSVGILPRVSGSLDSHYAPATPARLVETPEFDRLQGAPGLAFLPCTPREPHAYAHALYARLRALDAQGAQQIIIEAPPRARDWDGVNDRLKRAATRA